MKKVELTDYEVATILDLIDYWRANATQTAAQDFRIKKLYNKLKDILDNKNR